MTRFFRPLVWTVCTAVVLAFLLFVWHLRLAGDDAWITLAVGVPTTLFVGLCGVAVVAEAGASGRWRDLVIACAVCLLIVASAIFR